MIKVCSQQHGDNATPLCELHCMFDKLDRKRIGWIGHNGVAVAVNPLQEIITVWVNVRGLNLETGAA
jgi:hypothetical protein